MTKVSKQKIKVLEEFVESGFKLHLICDDDSVCLEQYTYKRKVRVFVYVNGVMKWAWAVNPDKHKESKYLMRKVVYRKVGRKKKREKVDTGCCQLDYASTGQALRYFNKVCDSVVVDEEKMSGCRMDILNKMLSKLA